MLGAALLGGPLLIAGCGDSGGGGNKGRHGRHTRVKHARLWIVKATISELEVGRTGWRAERESMCAAEKEEEEVKPRWTFNRVMSQP